MLQHSGTGILNEQAFKLALDEETAKGKPFYIVNVLLKDITETRNSLGEEKCNRMLTELAQELKDETGTSAYYFADALRVILASEQEVKEYLPKIRNYFAGERTVGYVRVLFQQTGK